MNDQKKELLYEKVLNQLQTQIATGVYRKGDKLPSESELIETMGVSRITVRKALAILAERGMICTSQGHGSEVLFSLEDAAKDREFAELARNFRRVFEETTQVRLMLEPEAARTAALVINDEQAAKLGAIAKGESLDNFHTAIMNVIGNSRLTEVFNELVSVQESSAPVDSKLPEEQQEIHDTISSQHMKIYEAIARHDGEFAYFYMKEHLNYITRLYSEYFRKQLGE